MADSELAFRSHVMDVRGRLLAAGLMLLSSHLLLAAGLELPSGYTLVAEDNCGDPGNQPHVIRGSDYVFDTSQVEKPYEYRDIIFDNEFCLLRYNKLNPQARYKVDVVYVSQKGAQRVQRLEANGHVVHDALELPYAVPRRYLFDIPPAAYTIGKSLDLKFVNVKGANAVVCYVRIWSTDPRPLTGEAQFWTPQGPVEADWVQQDRLRGGPTFVDWQDPAKEVRDVVVPYVNEQLDRGARILADLKLLNTQGLETSSRELAEAAEARDALLAARSLDPEAWLKAYRQARWAVRRLAFRNPLLECQGLLFVRRHHPHTMHQCARRLGSFTLPGGGICVLKGIRADGGAEVECLTEGRFPNGVFGRPALSFDGKRIVFGYAAEREADKHRLTYGGINQQTAPLFAHHETGPSHEFQVWEMGIDGKNPPPRQLTSGPCENADPLYLPNGRIAFMSHRGGSLVQCGDWALAYTLFTMNPDGSDVRPTTLAKDGEWDPCLLDDGSIGFTRWEYVMKFWAPIQMLWRVRPDGANPHLIYGSDMSRRYPYPLNYASARQVPGTSLLACIGSAHHNTGAGPLCLVDLRLGRDVAQGLRRLTPVRFVETSDQQPNNGWYDCPYPLSQNYFLVSYSLAQNETATRSYGIYLFDAYGGKELIYRDKELSALFPVPIRPRKPPLAVAEAERQPDVDWGEFLILDVHRGLPASAQGQARYLRIAEAHERPIHTNPYDIQVGPDTGFETKTVLGTVPIEKDGSAYFRVPANKGLFFAVLDKSHQALHIMRATTNVQPGESTGCVGCHEPMAVAPPNAPPLATTRPPSTITPPPWGIQPISFPKLVQPILDKHCATCHDGTKGEKKSFDLTARAPKPFMSVPIEQSYYALRRYVRHAPIFTYFLPPLSFGSRVSPLMQTLGKGHHSVQLSLAEWQLLCAWIDCNAPYLGDYGAVAARTAR